MSEGWAGLDEALKELYYFGKHHPGRTIKLEWFTTSGEWYCGLGEDSVGFGFAKDPASAIMSAIRSETRGGQR